MKIHAHDLTYHDKRNENFTLFNIFYNMFFTKNVSKFYKILHWIVTVNTVNLCFLL